MRYNKLERSIAYFLSKFPKFKLFVKKNYQKINYLINKKDYNYKSKYELKKITYLSKESFFGYYDKSPINKTNEFIIFHSSNTSTKQLPNPSIPIDIILYDIKNGKFKLIDKSYAYNWQQGSRLMWVDDYRFIYNIFEDNDYKSKIYDIKAESFKIIDFPIYDVFKDKFAFSLNFERLGIGRGDYAYKNKNLDINWKDNENDGLYFIDLINNKVKLIISLQDAIEINPKSNVAKKHKFNHIMISPNGKKIMFMHRWFLENNQKLDTLLIANVDGSNLKIVVNSGMVSHCFWYDNENIFGYLREFDGDKYYMININTLEKKVIGKNIIDKFGDGHPNIYKNNIVFDTYPDKSRILHLFIYNLKTNKLEELGEFFQSFDYYSETRCDLHPRFSFDGKKIFFDSVHEGKRYLYMMGLKND
ncbi:hypothetical protein [Nitrosophilus kaiyonis]|uniref:hypothetical protein n=1 Tax=Nitrosophilus kaiyonis TaxID=2930200 RepID=UPI0024909141|nr:hypothetical protein [Nitrosophilus kaiyonis]